MTHWCNNGRTRGGSSWANRGACTRKATHDPDASGAPTKCWQHSAEHRRKQVAKREEEARRERHLREQRTARQNKLASVVREMLPGLKTEHVKALRSLDSYQLHQLVLTELEGRER